MRIGVNPTLSPDAPVTLTVLDSGPRRQYQGLPIEITGSRMLVRMPACVAVGTPVRMEGDDTLLLGEVCAMQPERDGWVLAVRVEHSLTSLTDLESLNRALMGERAPQPSLRPTAK
jgi:hypothetical protein